MGNLLHRIICYWRTWRRKGAAKMEHPLWLFWALTGRYPR